MGAQRRGLSPLLPDGGLGSLTRGVAQQQVQMLCLVACLVPRFLVSPAECQGGRMNAVLSVL